LWEERSKRDREKCYTKQRGSIPINIVQTNVGDTNTLFFDVDKSGSIFERTTEEWQVLMEMLNTHKET